MLSPIAALSSERLIKFQFLLLLCILLKRLLTLPRQREYTWIKSLKLILMRMCKSKANIFE